MAAEKVEAFHFSNHSTRFRNELNCNFIAESRIPNPKRRTCRIRLDCARDVPINLSNSPSYDKWNLLDSSIIPIWIRFLRATISQNVLTSEVLRLEAASEVQQLICFDSNDSGPVIRQTHRTQ